MLDPRFAMIGLAFVAGVCSPKKPPRLAPSGPAANVTATSCRETDAGARPIRNIELELDGRKVEKARLEGGSMEFITCVRSLLDHREVSLSNPTDILVLPSPLGDQCDVAQIRAVSDDGRRESLDAVEWVCSTLDQPSGWVRTNID